MDEFDHNRRVYNEVAAAYHLKRQNPEKSAWNNLLEVPAMNELLRPHVKGKSVLDLGCGTGLLTREIMGWGGRVRGVDQSEKMIEIARADLPDVSFYVASAGSLPFEDDDFDVVASSLVMHYMKDLMPAFKEAARVLKKNGRFVFSMHHPVQESFKEDKEVADGKPVLQPYFHNEPYYWKMCGGEFLSYHHTFEDIIRGLSIAGFLVEDLIECRPSEKVRDTFKDYEFTSSYPTFCVFSGVKKFWI
ncbi:MAG: class I SAM-dependent methyltransferase [Bdellovibrionia bacterium]